MAKVIERRKLAGIHYIVEHKDYFLARLEGTPLWAKPIKWCARGLDHLKGFAHSLCH